MLSDDTAVVLPSGIDGNCKRLPPVLVVHTLFVINQITQLIIFVLVCVTSTRDKDWCGIVIVLDAVSTLRAWATTQQVQGVWR